MSTRLIQSVLAIFSLSILLGACSSSSSIKGTGNDLLDRALHRAYELRGTPYCSAGDTPDCFDCSGFVSYCMLDAGIQVPRTTGELFGYGEPVSFDNLEPGDLVFFRTTKKTASHVGFYIGDGAFIHSSTSSGVIISNMSDAYWRPRFLGGRRIG